MCVIETQGTVTADGELLVRVRVPENTAPGPHRVVVVIEEPSLTGRQPGPLTLPLLHTGSWPADLSLRREDLYGDWGR
jgi:hypothetical protein